MDANFQKLHEFRSSLPYQYQEVNLVTRRKFIEHSSAIKKSHDHTVGSADNVNNTHRQRLFILNFPTLFGIVLLVSTNLIPQCAISEPSYGSQRAKPQNQFSCEVIDPRILSDDGRSLPLISERCLPRTTIAILDSSGDKFIFDLIKNSRLISDKSLHERSIDRLGNKINMISGFRNEGLDDIYENAFYKNHQHISLDHLRQNDSHCHYQGNVNQDDSSVAAISFVEPGLLTGYFHLGQFSYHLIANTSQRTTILVKIKSQFEFPSNQELAPCFKSSQAKVQNQSTKLNRSRREAMSILPSGLIVDDSVKQRGRYYVDNKVLHEPYQRNTSSLFVELLVVHDHNQLKEYNGNTTLIAERTMQIVNIMNAFYRQLNIFVSLVGVVLWTTEDEIRLTEDGDSTLTNFLKYRYEKLLPRYHHDNAQLITSTSFNGSVVGKALKGTICTHYHSGGVNTDHSHSPAVVAVTLAHELGHNLGMEHDEDNKCTCPDEKCIMSSSSSFVHPKHWSSCSVEYLEDSRNHGLLECLKDEPEQVFGPICGNGFVEEGEDCDVGEPMPFYGTSKSRNKGNGNKNFGTRSSLEGFGVPSRYTNPCCDRATCKFVGNATCAQGPCCDLTRCSVFNATETRVCRPRKTTCDFEEICDGIGEYCPPDVYYHDGVECGSSPAIPNDETNMPSLYNSIDYNRNRSYCYQGKCASHETQCQLLWGTSGTTSRDICYKQNIHGNSSGNCGYDRKDRTYEVCESQNSLCGMLHCVHSQPNSDDSSLKTGKLSYGFESASILTVSFFVMSNQERIYCNGAIIDSGPYTRDPGLVPNGASCGEDKMCLNQKCVPVAEVIYKDWCPSDCNGNGICDNTGICHCNDGTVGTSCYQFFGSNFHLSLILYIIMFFGPIIALIVLAANHYRKQIKIWWFLHNRKIVLKHRGREPRHHDRPSQAMAYQAKDHKVSISEPIPLNQQTNKPSFISDQSNLANHDPWAETNTDPVPSAALISALTTPTHHISATAAAFGVTKSPGYRLEPLPRKPLEPLPPPVPPHQNRQETSTSISVQHTETISDSLRPVRAAPPPPPPPHANQRRAN